MNQSHNPERSVDMTKLPDWGYQPVSALTRFGQSFSSTVVEHHNQLVQTPPVTAALTARLREGPNFFNGPFVNVDGITIGPDHLAFSTRVTTFFDYLASSSIFGHNQGHNPIHPLAIQATILTPTSEGHAVLIEKRIGVEDFPNTLSVFGGALKPTDLDEGLSQAMIRMLQRKWGLELTADQLSLSGLGRENVNYVICPFFLVNLHQGQANELLERYRPQRQDKQKVFYLVSADPSHPYIDRLLDRRDIRSWNPLGHLNLLYGLTLARLLSPTDARHLLTRDHLRLMRQPLAYQYPIENHQTQFNNHSTPHD